MHREIQAKQFINEIWMHVCMYLCMCIETITCVCMCKYGLCYDMIANKSQLELEINNKVNRC